MIRNEYGLTVKQERFARVVAATGSLSAAYREAFNAEGMKPQTVHSRAYELSGKGQIQARVKALLEENQAKEQWTRDRARSFVRERLVQESTQAKDARDRLKAVELLGQLAEFDLFAGKKSDSTIRHEVKKPAEQNLREVIERILARDAVQKADAGKPVPSVALQ